MIGLQAKVGAFTVAGLILMLGMFFGLSDLKLSQTEYYRLSVGFPQVVGLHPGADVCYAGVSVGEVESIELQPHQAMVHMKIDKTVKVPKDSQFVITAEGVMGQNFVNIMPRSTADLNNVYADGDVVEGNEMVTMDTLLDGMNTTLTQVQTLLTSMNDLIGDENFKISVHDMAENMDRITSNLDRMTLSMANMAVNTQADIEQMAHNLNMLTASLMRSADNVEQMVSTFNGNGETGENLKQAVRNLTSTSARIEKMAAALEGVVTDPQVAEDLKATLHNVRGVSERADKMMGAVSNLKVKPGIETMYTGKSGDDVKNWHTNADITVISGEERDNKYLTLGIEDIGDGSNLDAYGGFRSGDLGAHAGVIDSKAGIGADAYIGDKVTLSVEGYDPNKFKLRSRLSYEVAPDTFLFTQVNDINNSKKRAAYVGLRHEF